MRRARRRRGCGCRTGRRGARRGRHAAVAVLGDPETCARRGERRHRRDVDRACAVAARADDLAHLEGGFREGPRGAQHRGGRSADFVERLALHLQGGEKGRKLRLAHAACKDLGEEGVGFGSAQGLHAVEGFKSGIHFVLLSFPVGFFRWFSIDFQLILCFRGRFRGGVPRGFRPCRRARGESRARAWPRA